MLRAMPIRTLVVLCAVVAVNVVPLRAEADEAAKADAKSKKKREASSAGGTAKQGEACKVDADCDQSGSAMICGRGKCEYDVSRVPVKT
jgi:hypothetical protein